MLAFQTHSTLAAAVGFLRSPWLRRSELVELSAEWQEWRWGSFLLEDTSYKDSSGSLESFCFFLEGQFILIGSGQVFMLFVPTKVDKDKEPLNRVRVFFVSLLSLLATPTPHCQAPNQPTVRVSIWWTPFVPRTTRSGAQSARRRYDAARDLAAGGENTGLIGPRCKTI